MANKSIWVVIPAAGVGKRMQADIPKQYLTLLGKTVLEHTLDCFLGNPAISGIVVAISPEDTYWPELAHSLQGFAIHTAPGGKERCDSVLNALEYLIKLNGVHQDTVVLVHDAARPCLSNKDLHLLLSAIDNHAATGALLATPVRDTMKRAVAGVNQNPTRIDHTEDRDGLWHALTPQLASLSVLHNALDKARQQHTGITDEASALEQVGLQPRLLEGSSGNIKITRPADLALAEFFLLQRLREEEE